MTAVQEMTPNEPFFFLLVLDYSMRYYVHWISPIVTFKVMLLNLHGPVAPKPYTQSLALY